MKQEAVLMHSYVSTVKIVVCVIMNVDNWCDMIVILIINLYCSHTSVTVKNVMKTLREKNVMKGYQ